MRDFRLCREGKEGSWQCRSKNGKRTPFSYFILAVPSRPVYIPATSCRDSSVVERLSYTQLVGGSSPSPCTKNFFLNKKLAQ